MAQSSAWGAGWVAYRVGAPGPCMCAPLGAVCRQAGSRRAGLVGRRMRPAPPCRAPGGAILQPPISRSAAPKGSSSQLLHFLVAARYRCSTRFQSIRFSMKLQQKRGAGGGKRVGACPGYMLSCCPGSGSCTARPGKTPASRAASCCTHWAQQGTAGPPAGTAGLQLGGASRAQQPAGALTWK